MTNEVNNQARKERREEIIRRYDNRGEWLSRRVILPSFILGMASMLVGGFGGVLEYFYKSIKSPVVSQYREETHKLEELYGVREIMERDMDDLYSKISGHLNEAISVGEDRIKELKKTPDYDTLIKHAHSNIKFFRYGEIGLAVGLAGLVSSIGLSLSDDRRKKQELKELERK